MQCQYGEFVIEIDSNNTPAYLNNINIREVSSPVNTVLRIQPDESKHV